MVEDRELESRPGPRQRPMLPITLISRKMVDRWGVEPLKAGCEAAKLTLVHNSPKNGGGGGIFTRISEFSE